GIVLGSAWDWPQVETAAALLQDWGIAFEVVVASAHRAPRRVQAYGRDAAPRGLKVIIAVAGMAAHLAGVLAAETTLPVIGVPMPGSHLKGLDSLLATVQMPAGVPVATMAIGSSGAKNAAIFAAQILALSDVRLKERLQRHKKELEENVIQQGEQIPAEYRPGE
ncbi:MAG: 5-(carboxyamino)imidazole ribonucleotide mutase, partial [Desulfobaccales bacterium]